MRTPTLDRYSKDLTSLAKQGKLDPVIGREGEIRRVIHILSRRKKNNPLLIGHPGVGKTAIVEGLAQKIIAGGALERLRKKRLLVLDLSGLISGTRYRGEFEQRLKTVTEELEKAEREIIIFIDELHMVTETRGTEGGLAASDMLKPALARGVLQAIGATTPEEYQNYIKKDLTLERRFQLVPVPEPDINTTIKILEGIREKYENYHNVKITDQAIKAAVLLSEKYIKDRYFPDKAVDLIDEASAKVSLETIGKPAKASLVTEKDIKEIVALWVNLPIEKVYT